MLQHQVPACNCTCIKDCNDLRHLPLSMLPNRLRRRCPTYMQSIKGHPRWRRCAISCRRIWPVVDGGAGAICGAVDLVAVAGAGIAGSRSKTGTSARFHVLVAQAGAGKARSRGGSSRGVDLGGARIAGSTIGVGGRGARADKRAWHLALEQGNQLIGGNGDAVQDEMEVAAQAA